jgi:hypothetical protein
MMNVSSVNSAALLILQQPSPANSEDEQRASGNGVLEIANGVSSEPSNGTKSAAAVAGKFAVDSAPPTEGKIVVGGLGAAGSWEELKELVNSSEEFTDDEKKEWLVKLSEMQQTFEGASEYLNSSEFAEVKALAQQFSGSSDVRSLSESHKAINNLAEKLGREEPFQEF